MLTLLLASTLVTTAAFARASEAPGSLCLAPQAPHAPTPAAAPTIHRLTERLQPRVVDRERAARRVVERVVEARTIRAGELAAAAVGRLADLDDLEILDLGDAFHLDDVGVVALELDRAVALAGGADRRVRVTLDRGDATRWERHGLHLACGADDGPVTGAMGALVALAKAPARGVDLALDALVGVAKSLPTILRAIV